ncbi:MAG: hypothetical protein JJT76_16060 [Clostridiaceae bacterium]|nr:hypothetical protein [Clostridiaceae bacterium]
MNKGEAKLISKVKKGDELAFKILVEAYEKEIYNLAYNITLNKDAAMNISIEVLTKVYMSIGDFKEDVSFSSWLYRLTINNCLQFNAEKKALKNSLLKGGVREAIVKLPEDQRIIIVLRDLQKLAYSEIAEILDIPLETIKSRLNMARWALKEILRDKGKTDIVIQSNGGKVSCAKTI